MVGDMVGDSATKKLGSSVREHKNQYGYHLINGPPPEGLATRTHFTLLCKTSELSIRAPSQDGSGPWLSRWDSHQGHWALSALSEKTSSWPRHSLSTWNYSQLVVKLMKTHVPFILNFSSSSNVTKNNETFEVFFWTFTSDFCQKIL